MDPRRVVPLFLVVLCAACEPTETMAPASSWHLPVSIDTRAASTPDVAMDAEGNAMILYRSTRGDIPTSWARRSTDRASWSEAELVAIGASEGRLAMAPSGDAIALWTQESAPRIEVYARRYVRDVGWGETALLDGYFGMPCGQLGCGASEPELVVGASGHALAVWRSAGEETSIWASYAAPGAPFAPRERVSTEGTVRHDSRPRAGIDAAGNAFVVWTEREASRDLAMVRRHVAGQGWEPARRLDPEGDGGDPGIVVAASGDAAAWWHHEGVMLARHTPGSGWGAPQRSPMDADVAQIVGGIDDGGVATLVHAYDEGFDVSTVTHHPSTGFTEPVRLEIGERVLRDLRLAVSTTGDAVATWVHSGQGVSVARQHGGGWEPTELIVDPFPALPDVALDANGNALVAWGKSPAADDEVKVSAAR